MAFSVPDLCMLCLSQAHSRRCNRRHAQSMESKYKVPTKKYMVAWADLPVELLAIISKFLDEPIDITRFRSVCRSWRVSRPSNNANSPHFPHKFYACLDPATFPNCQNQAPKYVIAEAIYLVRPLSDPSKSFLVSFCESVYGSSLRHALSSDRIRGCYRHLLDLSRCTLTKISVSHFIRFTRGQACLRCINMVHWPYKVVFATKNSDPDLAAKGLNSEVTGLFSWNFGSLCAFSPTDCLSHETRCVSGFTENIQDFVSFKGRVYAVDLEGTANVYVLLDYPSLQLLPMTCLNPPDYVQNGILFQKRFVVSDGDLYLFCNFGYKAYPNSWPPEFLLYKLIFEDDHLNRYRLERVEDLGDRVFLITNQSSFSIAGGDLPPPLAPNCVIWSRRAFYPDRDSNSEIKEYHLGGRPSHLNGIGAVNAYSALFTPIPSLLINSVEERN